MELILNTNKLGYLPFLETKINAFIVGLKNYCINQQFCLSIKELNKALILSKKHNKKFYLSINNFVTEKNLSSYKKIIYKLKEFPIDGFIVSDLGVFNIFRELNLENKVILELQTYVTNKYSAKSLLNFGANRVCLSKEITLNDIKDISNCNPNKIELLVQGYFPITYSKRPILRCYMKNFKIKNKCSLHYIKEETRADFYPLFENNQSLSVYNNNQYSLFNHLSELVKNHVSFFRIDSIFMNEKEILDYINYYFNALDDIKNNKGSNFEEQKKKFNEKYSFNTPFLYNESFLLKEGK